MPTTESLLALPRSFPFLPFRPNLLFSLFPSLSGVLFILSRILRLFSEACELVVPSVYLKTGRFALVHDDNKVIPKVHMTFLHKNPLTQNDSLVYYVPPLLSTELQFFSMIAGMIVFFIVQLRKDPNILVSKLQCILDEMSHYDLHAPKKKKRCV